MKDFRQLQIWERSHQLTLRIYRITRQFPSEERYGLIAQMRRSGSSIPTNIAEGCGRNSEADFARFLDHSMGSASELEYQLILSHDLGYLPADQFAEISSELIEIKRMINAFLQKLRAKS